MSWEAVTAEPGFVIHSRAYRERDFLTEIFTLNHGRVSAVMRLKKRNDVKRGLVQPFIPLRFDLLRGRSDLWCLQDVFMQGRAFDIKVPRLFCASYLNELLYRLYKSSEPSPRLFAIYLKSLEFLESDGDANLLLRSFESALLDFLGFAIRYEDPETGRLEPEVFYSFNPESGFYASDGGDICFKGSDLTKLSLRRNLGAAELKILKKLNQKIISFLLNGKSIKSRELYIDYMRAASIKSLAEHG